jgi:hypothetical protein
VPIKERPRKASPWAGKKARITVGIHGDEGASLKDDATFEADGALTPNSGLTVAEVAAFHEFGHPRYPEPGTYPPRSFIRGWFDESVAKNRNLIADQLDLVMRGKLTLEVALERVALKCEADVKRRIRNRIPPPLAESTKKRKGSSVPLIDTGQLRASVRGKAEVLP